MKRLSVLFLLVLTSVSASAGETLRLPSGEPVVGAYYFTRWWEPWRSDDERIRADLRILRDVGVNTLFIDHEPSQMFDGEWSGLDRDHRLAKEMGFHILPWLEAKCGRDVSVHDRFREVQRRWGVTLRHAETQSGEAAQSLVWDESFADYMVAWMSDYVDRYSDTGAILRVETGGETWRVISPCVELGWELVSFDDETNAMFREWVEGKYGTVEAVNSAWGTHYSGFAAIDPRDASIFDYSDLEQPSQSPAVVDHVSFRAEVCSDAFEAIKARMQAKYPDLLVVGELPYEFEYDHPHAHGYKWEYAATPDIARWTDILVFRTGGEPTMDSLEAMQAWTRDVGNRILLTHRVRPSQGPGWGEFSTERALEFAEMSADYAHGLGYYSWNEMVDTHMVHDWPESHHDPRVKPVSLDEYARLIGRVSRINQAYIERVNR